MIWTIHWFVFLLSFIRLTACKSFKTKEKLFQTYFKIQTSFWYLFQYFIVLYILANNYRSLDCIIKIRFYLITNTNMVNFNFKHSLVKHQLGLIEFYFYFSTNCVNSFTARIRSAKDYRGNFLWLIRVSLTFHLIINTINHLGVIALLQDEKWFSFF